MFSSALFSALVLASAPAFAGALELNRDLVIETEPGLEVSRILVTSEFTSGSRKLREEQERTAKGWNGAFGRYMGFDIAASTHDDPGAARIRAGKHKNFSTAYRVSRWFGAHVSGKPGIVALVIRSDKDLPKHTRDNGKIEFDRRTVKLEPTHYLAGPTRAVIVEFGYDELKQLLDRKRAALEGRVRYYVRGAFNEMVYDAYPISDDRPRYEAPQLEKGMASLLESFARGTRPSQVCVRIDAARSTKSTDTIRLDLAAEPLDCRAGIVSRTGT